MTGLGESGIDGSLGWVDAALAVRGKTRWLYSCIGGRRLDGNFGRTALRLAENGRREVAQLLKSSTR